MQHITLAAVLRYWSNFPFDRREAGRNTKLDDSRFIASHQRELQNSEQLTVSFYGEEI